METATSVAGQRPRIEYRGRLGELYGIFLVNLLLTVVTLGVYLFWAKSRLRRYVWSHTSFDGEQFEYTGRGRELLVGYGKALAILVPLFLLYNLNPVYQDDPRLVALFSVISLLVYLGFIVFGGVAQFSSRRYRLSRTRWRGMRCALSGSAWVYGRKTLAGAILATITLGLYTPFMRHHLAAYQLENLWFGSERVTYTGNGAALFRLFVKVWLAALAIIVAVPFAVGIVMATLMPARAPSLALGVGPVVVVAVIVGAVIVAWYAYVAGELKYLAAHARLGSGEGLTLRLDFTTLQFAWFTVSNLLLMLATLGLALPLVLLRKLRFACRHMEVRGQLDYDAVQQSRQPVPASGEGLAQALDIGDLGL